MTASEKLFVIMRKVVKATKEAYAHMCEAYEVSKEISEREARTARHIKMVQESHMDDLEANYKEVWKEEK